MISEELTRIAWTFICGYIAAFLLLVPFAVTPVGQFVVSVGHNIYSTYRWWALWAHSYEFTMWRRRMKREWVIRPYCTMRILLMRLKVRLFTYEIVDGFLPWDSPPDYVVRRIIASAMLIPGPVYLKHNGKRICLPELTIVSSRHWDPLARQNVTVKRAAFMLGGIGTTNMAWKYGVPMGAEQGFIDQFGHFWGRKDAMALIKESGQINQLAGKQSPDGYDECYSEMFH